MYSSNTRDDTKTTNSKRQHKRQEIFYGLFHTGYAISTTLRGCLSNSYSVSLSSDSPYGPGLGIIHRLSYKVNSKYGWGYDQANTKSPTSPKLLLLWIYIRNPQVIIQGEQQILLELWSSKHKIHNLSKTIITLDLHKKSTGYHSRWTANIAGAMIKQTQNPQPLQKYYYFGSI